ncbi:MAG: CPBP family intramembrane metalloprotease [Bacteroidales bacterium]|nr:CPBP family intramembrane metalloprotease [Bacteroidales bacterium]
MKEFSFNLNRHCLVPGIVLLVLGITGTSIYPLLVGETQTLIETSGITDMLIDELPLFMLIMTLLFAPIVEEFSYRSWAMKSKFWKYFSLIAISAYTYLTTYSIIITCVAFVVLLFLFCIFKGDKHKDLILFLRILVTSILFSLAHYQNESGWFSVIAFFDRLGFALIACYLTLRFRFIYAILFHFANNMLAFALSYFFATDYTFEINDETHTAKLTEISMFDDQMDHWDEGDIVYTGCLPVVAYELTSAYEKDIMYYPLVSRYNHYCYCATAIDSTKPINGWQLFDELLQQTGLRLDTVIPEKIYHIEITDTSRLIGSGKYENKMRYFVRSLRRTYGKMFVIDEEDENIMISTATETKWQIDMDNLIPHLYEKYGLKCEERDNKDYKIVYISEP